MFCFAIVMLTAIKFPLPFSNYNAVPSRSLPARLNQYTLSVILTLSVYKENRDSIAGIMYTRGF